MDARVGDVLVVGGHHVGEPERRATVVAVRGDAGGPPYMVRWHDSDHETLYFPSSDCQVVAASARETRST